MMAAARAKLVRKLVLTGYLAEEVYPDSQLKSCQPGFGISDQAANQNHLEQLAL